MQGNITGTYDTPLAAAVKRAAMKPYGVTGAVLLLSSSVFLIKFSLLSAAALMVAAAIQLIVFCCALVTAKKKLTFGRGLKTAALCAVTIGVLSVAVGVLPVTGVLPQYGDKIVDAFAVGRSYAALSCWFAGIYTAASALGAVGIANVLKSNRRKTSVCVLGALLLCVLACICAFGAAAVMLYEKLPAAVSESLPGVPVNLNDRISLSAALVLLASGSAFSASNVSLPAYFTLSKVK